MNPHSDMPIPEHQSIFTDTMHGVPSPTIPHTHPYPTRYHGPVYTTPRFGLPYRMQTMVAPPGILNWTDLQGLGEEPLLMGRVTDSGAMDAAIGAAAGYIAAPSKEERVMWSAGAGMATWLLGKAGLIAVVGAALYVRFKKR